MFSMSWTLLQEADAADVVGLLADDEASAADVLVGVGDRRGDLREGDALAPQPERVDLHVVLLGLAAVARDVDDAVDLSPLPLQDPVLDRLQVADRVALALEGVAVDLSDGVPRRERPLETVGERDELQAVDDLLPDRPVVRAPLEVALDVREPEERLRPGVLEPLHAGHADLERDRHVPLDLLGAPAGRLDDDLDHRRARVRVSLDVQPVVGREPADHDGKNRSEDHGAHAQRRGDESLDHGLVTPFVAPAREGGTKRQRCVCNRCTDSTHARTDQAPSCRGQMFPRAQAEFTISLSGINVSTERYACDRKTLFSPRGATRCRAADAPYGPEPGTSTLEHRRDGCLTTSRRLDCVDRVRLGFANPCAGVAT